MEEKEASYTVSGNVNWDSHYRKQSDVFLKNYKVTIWSSNPISGHISRKDDTLIWKDICTPMFIAALFTIAKT